jgi:Cu/Ag efflux protein CusF
MEAAMKTLGRVSAGLTLALALSSGAVFAQTQTPPPAASPEKVEGQVVRIDQKAGKVTIKASDGTTHEFQANAETLKGLKVGDRIEARLRQ